MRVKLILDGKLVRNLSNPSKRRVSQIITLANEKIGSLNGTCTVTYKPGFYNEFEFNSTEELRSKLRPCLEDDLIKSFS